jgi:ubiquitin C-terminal hydrolase
MSDLIKYKESLILKPRGLINNSGHHCYWNSTLQAIMSCTQFISEIQKLLPDQEGTIVESFNNFINEKITNMELYKDYIVALHSIGKTKEQLNELINNQQCVGETLSYFLEIFEHSKPIIRLFKHRYAHEIECPDCNYIKKSISTSITFEIKPNNNLKNELFKTTEIIEDYKCEKCFKTNPKQKLNQLKMLPEILIILVKNYEWSRKKFNDSDFPEILNINPLKYRAVAYVDHYGGINSGHYISTCLRRGDDGDIKWHMFNDNHFTPTSYAPNVNTYIIIYCYFDEM